MTENVTVSPELLKDVALHLPGSRALACERGDGRTPSRKWALPDILSASGVGFTELVVSYGTIYKLDRCLTSSEHTDGAALIEFPSGAIAYKCHHDRCSSMSWRDAKQALRFPTLDNGALSENEVPTGDLPKFVLRRASDIEPQSVEWLWHNKIPYGMPTVLDGDPGKGKSSLTIEIAAAVSTGRPLPGDRGSVPGDVVIVNLEDHHSRVIVPRLIAAEADRTRIHLLTEVAGRLPTLPDDCDLIHGIVEETRAKLLVIDPVMAALAGSTDTHRDQDVRRAFAPLVRTAEETGVALLIVRHLNKRAGGQAIYRGQGAIGFIGLARSGLLLEKHPQIPEDLILAVPKGNLAPPQKSIALKLVGQLNGMARVEWGEECEISAEEALAAAGAFQVPETRSKTEEAIEWLRVMLGAGSLTASEAWNLASKDGISKRTLMRAKSALGIQSVRRGYGRGSHSVWVLPSTASDSYSANSAIERHEMPVAQYGESGSVRAGDNSGHDETAA